MDINVQKYSKNINQLLLFLKILQGIICFRCYCQKYHIEAYHLLDGNYGHNNGKLFQSNTIYKNHN
jgi:hypothetical protein